MKHRHRPPAPAPGRPAPARGVSLVEALVALAVLGLGILGVVGMQSTLRQNGDVSRQRAEAVRVASQEMEHARGYVQLGAAPQGQGFADIGAVAQTVVAAADRPDANEDFTVRRTVPAANPPGSRSLTVEVEWRDRASGQDAPLSRVTLATLVHGTPPELAGSISIPAQRGVLQRPLGRHGAIPAGAVIQQSGGTSVFVPPGAPPGVNWTFDNVSGEITRVCEPACTDVRRFLLTGFVRFATLGPPSPADSETPPGLGFAARVEVALSNPSPGSVVPCFQASAAAGSVQYFCAVPTTTLPPLRWSGRSRIVAASLPAGRALAATLADATATSLKVCRYTPVASDTPPRGNIDHPLDYTDVRGPLTGQNFLVIAAGDGTLPYACPGDDAATPLVNGNTFRHQPLS